MHRDLLTWPVERARHRALASAAAVSRSWRPSTSWWSDLCRSATSEESGFLATNQQ
jgi:hypothetical protein